MIFRICEKHEQILYRWDVVQLRTLDQTDSGFQTAFDISYYDSIGRRHSFGIVKIGRRGMKPGRIKDVLPDEFAKLPEDFFSLGQDEYYYERIKDFDKQMGDQDRGGMRHELLKALRDAAYDLSIFETNLAEAVMKKSLLIHIVTDDDEDNRKAVAKVKGQFNRMAEKGHARLTKYHFSYTAPQPKEPQIKPVSLEFAVDPASNPPTNVHAMIGRNGCGKTHLIHHMVQCLQDKHGNYGRFNFFDNIEATQEFANVICIAFSPFDSFPKAVKKKRDLPATFVGLNEDVLNQYLVSSSKSGNDKENISSTDTYKDDRLSEQNCSENRLMEAICDQFWKYLRYCMITSHRQMLWVESITTLKTGFNEYECVIFQRIQELIDSMKGKFEEEKFQGNKQNIMDQFKALSSGHKVVLLTITSCVAEIEERSILFLDEPENHLHPPLLSALIRTLSDLLRKRNGVAIVSTHSPIVLQEIPQSCVWLLTRYGLEYIEPDRLDRETFGASLGTLIDDAFNFEVNQSGFHKLMVDAAEKYNSFEEVLELYQGQLGNEAGILLRMLMRKKRWKEQENALS